MRGAAAKFLVQFPDLPVGQQLARNEAVTVEQAAATAENTQIEAVPIDDPAPDAAANPAVQTPAAPPTTAAPEPSPSGATPDKAPQKSPQSR